MISPRDWRFGSGQLGQSCPCACCCVYSGLLGTLLSEIMSPPKGFLFFLDSQPPRGFVLGSSPLLIPYPTSGPLEAEEPADPVLGAHIPFTGFIPRAPFSIQPLAQRGHQSGHKPITGVKTSQILRKRKALHVCLCAVLYYCRKAILP